MTEDASKSSKGMVAKCRSIVRILIWVMRLCWRTTPRLVSTSVAPLTAP